MAAACHVLDARSVEEFGEGCRAKDPGVALRRLLRIATVVHVVKIAADKQARHLRATSDDQHTWRKSRKVFESVATKSAPKYGTLAASSLALMLNVG